MRADRHADRTVVVTGAASGIGRGIATRFAEEGADVVVADVRREPKQGEFYDTDATEPTDELVRQEGRDALYVETDVSDPESVQSMVDATVEEFGGIDVLVNNAGIVVPGSSQDLSIDEWRQVIGVNLDGQFFCAKYVIPHVVEREGAIVNVASVHAIDGGAGPPYASTKAGIVNLTRDLAVELGDTGVRVNAVCPGAIGTPMQDLNTEEILGREREASLVGRIGEPRDVANAAVFLASDEASFVDGQALFVDGGRTAYRGFLQ